MAIATGVPVEMPWGPSLRSGRQHRIRDNGCCAPGRVERGLRARHRQRAVL